MNSIQTHSADSMLVERDVLSLLTLCAVNRFGGPTESICIWRDSNEMEVLRFKCYKNYLKIISLLFLLCSGWIHCDYLHWSENSIYFRSIHISLPGHRWIFRIEAIDEH